MKEKDAIHEPLWRRVFYRHFHGVISLEEPWEEHEFVYLPRLPDIWRKLRNNPDRVIALCAVAVSFVSLLVSIF